jgi:hypothetical protein
MQPVIPHSDPESDADPIKNGRDNQGLPTEHEERGDGADMQQRHNPRSKPIKVAVIGLGRDPF